MTSDLPLEDRLSQAIEMLQAGERSAAASWLARLWPEVVEGGDPLLACRLAHFAADAQDDVTAELHWDLVALEQARRASETSWPGNEEISAFFPSLHLNVADCYLRLGDLEHCRDHFDHA